MLKRAWLGVILFLALISLLGCNTNNASPQNPGRDTSGFVLNVLNDSYVPGGSAAGFDLSFEDYDNSLLVNVRVNGAQDLKALYFNLAYDPSLYRPMVVNNSGLMGSNDDIIHLEYFKTAGQVTYGQVLTNYDLRTGYTGAGSLATVMFSKEPALAVHGVSVAPTNTLSATTLTLTGNILDWFYFNNGDYDQNGLVSISDLTPLGHHLNEQNGTPPAAWPVADALGQIDGNSDGALTINDVTNIGQWMNNSALGGWTIYTSTDIADMPATAGGPNGSGASEVTAAFLLADAENFANATTERLHFTYDLGGAPAVNAVFWVRPKDATNNLGTPSNPASPPNPDAPVLAFTSTPMSGTGTSSDRYHIPATGTFNFTLIDPTDGHVEATSTWSVTPVADGTIDNTTTPNLAVLTLAGGLVDGDQFTVGAQYVAETSNPALLYFEIDTGPLPTGEFIVPDATDTNWGSILTANDGTELDPFVLDNTDLAKTYRFTANTSADGSGTDLAPYTDFTWQGYPPFVATWTVTASEASMVANQFTSGYVFFQNNTTTDNSDNNVYVVIKALPS